jgi:pilus assembly protein CpaB
MSMNRLQIIVLGVSVFAFGGAYFVFNNYLGAQRKAPVIVQAPKFQTEKVLVASQDIPMGSVLTENLVNWSEWPKDNVSEKMITKTPGMDLTAELKDTMSRDSFLRGEPLNRDKLVKAGVGSYMAAILPSGMRAVAIKIDNSGDTSAGGFILPNDRVDVVRVFRDDDATRARGTEVLAHQTVLANVRVLAIGQNIQDQNGKKVVVGGNATLELDPKQAEIVLYAQNMPGSHLNLVLRALVDSSGGTQTVNDPSESQSSGLTIVRYGAAQQAAR